MGYESEIDSEAPLIPDAPESSTQQRWVLVAFSSQGKFRHTEELCLQSNEYMEFGTPLSLDMSLLPLCGPGLGPCHTVRKSGRILAYYRK